MEEHRPLSAKAVQTSLCCFALSALRQLSLPFHWPRIRSMYDNERVLILASHSHSVVHIQVHRTAQLRHLWAILCYNDHLSRALLR